jgi:uncharacterized membrane protein
MLDIIQLNLLAFAIFILCISVYGIQLKLAMRKPGTAKRGLLNIFYGEWVKIMATQKDKIIPIQTMRNLIMSVTFLSSSILVMLGVLVRFNDTGFMEFTSLTNLTASNMSYFKIMILSITLVFSLLAFLLSLRQMVRFTILIGIPYKDIEKKGSKEIEETQNIHCYLDARALQQEVFIKAMNRFTYGIRAVFYSIILLFWFMGPYMFIAASIIITIFLIQFIDVRTPCEEETPI